MQVPLGRNEVRCKTFKLKTRSRNYHPIKPPNINFRKDFSQLLLMVEFNKKRSSAHQGIEGVTEI